MLNLRHNYFVQRNDRKKKGTTKQAVKDRACEYIRDHLHMKWNSQRLGVMINPL